MLAAQPGSFREESSLHARFGHLATGENEFFHNTPRLIAHVHDVIKAWPTWETILKSLDDRVSTAVTAHR